LRGMKGEVYEGGIHVPFAARWSAGLPKGAVYDEPVISLDIFATAAAAAGAAIPPSPRLDSMNLLPYLERKKTSPPHDLLFWRAGGGARYAVRQGRYKLVHNADGPDELYDLKADLAETRNLSAEKPELFARLQKSYREWNAQLVPPRWENLGAARPPRTNAPPR